jgi:hypothetical protein
MTINEDKIFHLNFYEMSDHVSNLNIHNQNKRRNKIMSEINGMYSISAIKAANVSEMNNVVAIIEVI